MNRTKIPKTALRRDAQLRRDVLIRAATELFNSDGLDVSLEKIAARAGVSRTTLYRNFPDREALVVLMLKAYLDELAAQVAQWNDRDDAFFLAIRALANRSIAQSGFEKIVPLHLHAPSLAEGIRRGVEEILAAPLVRAKAPGLIRADFRIGEVHLLILMATAGGLEDPRGNTAAGIERALQMLARGYLPPSAQRDVG